MVKDDVDGFSYFSLISVILFYNQDHKGIFEILRHDLVWCSLRLINHEACHEKGKLLQTRLYKSHLFKNLKYSL